MKLPGAVYHVIIVLVLYASAVPIAGIQGRFLAKLGILDQHVVSALPFMAGVAYWVAAAAAWRWGPKRKWIPPIAGLIVALPLASLPQWIFSHSTTKIDLTDIPRSGRGFVPHSVIREFESRFSTHVVQYSSSSEPGPNFVVPSSNYSPHMRAELQVIAERQIQEAEKARPSKAD